MNTAFLSHRYLRVVVVLMAIAICLFVIQSTFDYGVSQVMTTYALTAGNTGAAEKAIAFSPHDAEARLAGAALLSFTGKPEQALVELERAVALRPADYRLWSELGLLRDQTGDTAGALAAFDEAIRRAPFYSQPRWNRGNVLLRKGDYEAAFNDLNQAADSNPELIPSLLDLAWGIARGDVTLTEQLAQIKGHKKRTAFARLLAARGKAKEAVAQFDDARNVSEPVKRELVEQLMAKGAFKEAFTIWRVNQVVPGSEGVGASIYDGGFESALEFNQGGFSWRFPSAQPAVSVSLDSSQPHSGAQNLRIEFSGNSNPGSLLVSQVILVEPSRSYQIHFAARSQEVVTGGLPFLNLSEAAGDEKRLGKSRPLASGNRDWQAFKLAFTTTPTTTAVVLSLQRENCTTSPCPIFGSMSLDSFSIEEVR